MAKELLHYTCTSCSLEQLWQSTHRQTVTYTHKHNYCYVAHLYNNIISMYMLDQRLCAWLLNVHFADKGGYNSREHIVQERCLLAPASYFYSNYAMRKSSKSTT